MIKVGFNNSALSSGHKTRGIGFYTKNLLAELKNNAQIQIEEFADDLDKLNVDLVHYPYFDLYRHTLSITKKFPTIVTIHDLTPLVFKDHYPPGIRGQLNYWLQRLSLANVAAIITDSHHSKKDIVERFGILESKVFVTHLAVGSHFQKLNDQKRLQKTADKYKLPTKFCLYVGNVNWNKNLLGLTQASLDAGMEIVLVGKSFGERDNLNHPELKSFKNFLEKYQDNPGVHILDFVEDDELVDLYNLATVALLPSFYEGFGLTILEAQSCGTPVVAGRNSSIVEVVGDDSALLVDPYKVSQISQVIRDLVADTTLRNKIIKLGFENVKRFSWSKTAEETVKVYQLVYERLK